MLNLKKYKVFRNKETYIDWYPYLMIFPALLFIIVLTLYPLLKGIQMSFYDWTLILPDKPFIGLGNYIELWNDSYFWSTITNTLLFSLLSVLLSTILGLGVALLLNQQMKGRGMFRAVTLIPWVTPSVIIAYIFWWIFNSNFSPVNHLLMELGFIDNPIGFLSDIKKQILGLSMPFWTVLFVRVWTSYTFKAIMFLATLQSIPKDIYESASIDGANIFQKFRLITIPFLVPVMVVVTSLSIIWNLSHFPYNYLLTKGGPFGATNVMGVFVYQKAFSSFRFGYASAAGIVILLFASIFAFLYFRFQKKESDLQ